MQMLGKIGGWLLVIEGLFEGYAALTGNRLLTPAGSVDRIWGIVLLISAIIVGYNMLTRKSMA